METITPFVNQYGYILMFGVGLLEFGGAPIASVPVLIAAGAIAHTGPLSPVLGALLAAAGGLVGDATWFSIARWRGRGLIDMVCGLASNPRACITGVEAKVAHVGPKYILPAKFLPGTSNLIAAASGYAGIPTGRFLFFDSIALVVWAGLYVTIGVIFAAQVDAAIGMVVRFSRVVVVVAVLLIGAAVGLRLRKIRRHKGRH